jgi:membrane protein
VTHGPAIDTLDLFHRFLPPHSALPDRDPFGIIERVLTGITQNRGKLSIYAAPAFLWFSTRLFAGIRTSLNEIYDVSVRPPRPRPFIAVFLLAKLRDAIMVVGTVTLFLANTLLTTGLAILQARGAASVPQLAFFVSTLGRLFGELLAFGFSVSLFYVTYRYASVRRLPWSTALFASIFTAILFELAKRLYGLYLANFASFEAQGGDANLGAAVLFVLWVYYTAIVFLLGAVVAETWELRKMQQRQRAILG